MPKSKTFLFIVNLVGGIAVLGSYVYGLASHPGQGAMLWGAVPESVRGPYTAMMFPAALGYLTMFSFLMTAETEYLEEHLWGGLGRFNLMVALFLLSAASWMPACWYGIDKGLAWMVWPIQGVLAVTGLTAVFFVWQLLQLPQTPRPRFRMAAVIGAGFLSIQCTLIDGLIWPRFFTIG